MADLDLFRNLHLRGGFVIVDLQITSEPLTDALEREAIAKTRIIGREFHLLIRSGLSEKELSVTLYHEVLEAASVGSLDPPESVIDFNEGDFERVAYDIHNKLGPASPENLNQMLQNFGFRA